MLTPTQIEARKGKLTASRVAVLMNGVAEEVLNLYLELIGERPEDDLSQDWPVQLGSVTETLNLDWYEMKSGQPITNRGRVMVHPKNDWAACTLDGWDCILKCPVETKHVGGREPLETIIDRYQPQMQWQCFVTGASQCALSVIFGANEPIVEYIPAAPDYILEMARRGLQFMLCVRDHIPPVTLPPVPPPADASKVYDMTGNNKWAFEAANWIDNYPAAAIAKDAEKSLKALVPEDAKKCEGHGVRITRDRAGRLSLREAS